MSGGLLMARDDGLFRRMTAALVELGGNVAAADLGGEVVQLEDQTGRLFTLYERVPKGTEWEFRDEPVTTAQGVHRPDLQRVTACPFECLWPDLVARLAGVAGTDRRGPHLVIGRGWSPLERGAVNAAEVRL